jgi:hypothetical protein
VQPLDPSFYTAAFHRPVGCRLASKIFCPCVEGPNSMPREVVADVVEGYREGLRKLVSYSIASHLNTVDKAEIMIACVSVLYITCLSMVVSGPNIVGDARNVFKLV